MNTLLLMRLELTKFKGVDHLVVEPKGKDISICGANRLGKTTTGDALTWLLFDKDMQGRAKFNLKTLDDKATEISHVDHAVEGLFLYNGEEITLKKILVENHTKKRGQAKASFTGNVTEYYIDGLKTTQGKYKKLISDITDEQTFRLLTVPFYFAEGMKWEKRREILLDICGDVSDADIIAGSEKLKALPGILNGKDAEEYGQHLKEQRKKVNEQLNKIPVQIEENSRDLVDISGIDSAADSKAIVNLTADIIKKEKALAEVGVGGAGAELAKSLTEIQGKIANHERKAADELAEKVRTKKSDKADLENNKKALEFGVKTLQTERGGKVSAIETIDRGLAQLNSEYDLLISTTFEMLPGLTCEHCTQDIPGDLQMSSFTSSRKTKADQINVKGELLTKDKATHQGRINEIDGQIAEQEKVIDVEGKALATCAAELTEFLERKPYASGAHESDISEERRIENRIALAGKGDTSELKTKIEGELEELRAGRIEVEGRLALIEQHNKVAKRTEELKDEDKTLNIEFERIEKELFLIEEFIKAKVYSLGVKVSEKFGDVKFKLFETLINGGVSPCCDVLVSDSKALVPFGSANNAGRINTGLKIINVLSDHYGVKLPTIIDNCEAINDVEPAGSQMIKLIVTKDENLVFKVDN